MDPWKGLGDSLTAAVPAQCWWGDFILFYFERRREDVWRKNRTTEKKSQCKGPEVKRTLDTAGNVRQRMPGTK